MLQGGPPTTIPLSTILQNNVAKIQKPPEHVISCLPRLRIEGFIKLRPATGQAWPGSLAWLAGQDTRRVAIPGYACLS